MPITVRWYDDDQTIIHMPISDPWTITDLTLATQESYRMMAQVGHTVDLIMDASETTGIPRNILSHFATNTTEATLPTNQGFVLVVVRNTLLQTFVSMAKRILPHITRKMHMADSLPGAVGKIMRLRETVETAT